MPDNTTEVGNCDNRLQKGTKSHGNACAKAILIGEHAAVYGARAIATPVTSMRVNLRLKVLGGTEPSITARLGNQPVSDHLAGVIRDGCRLLDIGANALRIDGQSDVLIGAGLGSSAALAVAILRALSRCAGRLLSFDELAMFGNELERRFHGQPSGLDTAVVAYEKLIEFRKGSPITVLQPNRSRPYSSEPRHAQSIAAVTSPAPSISVVASRAGTGPVLPSPTSAGSPGPSDSPILGWPLVLIDSGIRASTKMMIKIAQPFFQAKDGDRRLGRFDDLGLQVRNAIETDDLEKAAVAMNEAGILLDEALVVGDDLRRIMSVAKQLGALSAKPTGAGGGGCVLAALPEDCASQVAKRLENQFGAHRIHHLSI